MASADRLIEVFSEAKARPAGAERERFLAEACRDEPALQEQVLRLLQAHDGAGDFLKNSVTASATLLTEKPGDKIGRYKLLQQIGEGGCGVVYMAEQEEPVRRRVALKVIKLGMDTKSVIARFEAERQALALMDHPNIAKVLDAGATETGRPYFVMELVRGIKITDYCDQNNLSTEERLKLFTQVCQAIQHAHQKGIIHRDIKPSNILVTQNESVAMPKVIDFGIAKATTDQRLTDKTVFTAFEQFIGTPAYMSPEQAMMTSLDIDTRTDIYALGVLLYELLTGQTPFDADELMTAGLDAMRRTICEQEPPKPSTRLTQELVAADVRRRNSGVTEPSASSPRRLQDLIRLLRGDLDWIVMKALEKDRRRRYETANGLAVDIQRHLSHEPVVACPPSPAYRFQKFVRRNKHVVVAASAVAAALVLGLVVSTWMFFKEKDARQRAVAAEQEQALLRRKAEAEVAARRQLDQFLAELTKRLRQERNLTEAEAVIRQELALERKLSGDEHPWVANSLGELAVVLRDAGKTNEAELAIREALEICRKLPGNLAPDATLGETLYGLGRYNEAEDIFRHALAGQRKVRGNEHREIANSLAKIGTALWSQHKPAEAEEMFREALAMRRKLLGSEHPDVARSLSWLGTALQDQGKLAEAETNYRESLALSRKRPADDLQLAATLAELTRILLRQEKFTEAEPLARESLTIRETKIPDDWNTFANRTILGGILLGQMKYAEAEPLLLSGYEGLKQREENIHAVSKPMVKTALQRLVKLYEATGQSEKAAEWSKTLAEFDLAEATEKAAVPKP